MHPLSTQSNLRKSLAQYLTQECDRFFENMDWEYYQIDRGYADKPVGAVYLTQIQRENNFPADLDYVPKTYRIQVSLKLFDADFKTALDRAADWEEEICDRIIKNLQVNGYNGLFKGIHCDFRQPSIIQENKNQDEGGTVNVHMFFIWRDDGAIYSALDVDEFLLD